MLSAALCALGMPLSTLVVLAGPADANPPRCVSRNEFPIAQVGWSKTRVHRLFDTAGSRMSLGDGIQRRQYTPCWDEDRLGDAASVALVYRQQAGVWRVARKINPNCASSAEFDEITLFEGKDQQGSFAGDALADVMELFDTSGWEISWEHGFSTYAFRQCGVDYGYYTVSFSDLAYDDSSGEWPGPHYFVVAGKSGPDLEPDGIWNYECGTSAGYC